MNFGKKIHQFRHNASILDENARQKSKKQNFENLSQDYLPSGPFFHMRPNLLKSAKKWRSYKKIFEKFFRKKILGGKIPNAGPGTPKKIFSQKLEKNVSNNHFRA